MARRVPNGFTSIADAQRRRDQSSSYNIIGVCVDHLPPAQSRGADLCMKLILWDTSCIGAEDVGQQGMVVRLFCTSESYFPPLQNNGDIVVIKNIKSKQFGSQWIGISTFDTRWVVVPSANVTHATHDTISSIEQLTPASETDAQKKGSSPQLNLVELKYARELVLAKDPSTLHAPPKSTALDVYTVMKNNGGEPGPLRPPKMKTLSELKSPEECRKHQFVDLIGELRKVYDNGQNVVELKISDYTENHMLFDYDTGARDGGAVADWSGPGGKMTITVNIWGEHATHIRELVREDKLRIGMFVRIRNIQIKSNVKFGTLEGYLRDGNGNNFGNSILIYMPEETEHDPIFNELRTRRMEYLAKDRAQFFGVKPQELATKNLQQLQPQPQQIEDKGAGSTTTMSKTQAKRAKKKAAKAKNATTDGPQSLLNQHVRCEAIEVPLTKISYILEAPFLDRETLAGNPVRLPFQNCKYKSKVKVVDFFPDNLEDFAVPFKSDYEALSDDEEETYEEATLAYARDNPDHVRWEWHFFLMVEDFDKSQDATANPEVLILQVADKDGDYLFNAEACDLGKNPIQLATLRQKLFVLWGDLEEKRAEHHATGTQLRQHGHAVSSRPFECFIQEYGVGARNENGEKCERQFERMFSMFGTRIC